MNTGGSLNIATLCVFAGTRTECPELPQPLGGTVVWTGLAPGDTAFYFCDDGFELVGHSQRVCQSTLQWNLEAPFCRSMLIIISIQYMWHSRTIKLMAWSLGLASQ